MRARSVVEIETVTRVLERARESISSARRENAGFSFNLRNHARDLSARHPPHNIFYYKAVSDKGRVAITALENMTNRYPLLHFKVSETEWVVTRQVRASRPLRITELARSREGERIHEAVAEALLTAGPGRVPGGIQFLLAFRRMQQTVIDTFRQATLDATNETGTKSRFYGVGSSPLSESFRTDTDEGGPE